MTTFDEHSRDEVFRDYLRHATQANHFDTSSREVDAEHVALFIGRGQIHATLAHAAATLLAAMPEPLAARYVFPSEVTAERDALRLRVDELVAQGLSDVIPQPQAPVPAPLCTCGHHQSQHRVTDDDEWCDSCQDLCNYTPNTSEVDGWSEPAARGARFRVARFEQNGHVPPVFFKVTDQLGRISPEEYPRETQAQLRAAQFNQADAVWKESKVPCAECGHRVHSHLKLGLFGKMRATRCDKCGCPKFVSTSTETSVETEAPSRLHTDTPTTE